METLNISEMVKEVNRFDKKFGLSLKDPDIWMEPEMYLESFLDNSDKNIGDYIYILNGIPLEELVDEFGVFQAVPVNPEKKKFQELSCLNWEDTVTTYEKSDKYFKLRFITQILYHFLGRIDRISMRKNKEKNTLSEAENSIIISMDIVKDINRFINCYLNPKSTYQNIIIKIFYHLSYSKKKISYKELSENVHSMVIDLRKNINHGIFDKRETFDEDMVINIILQLAYMFATGDCNSKNGVPKFKHIEGCAIKNDIFGLIEYLGKSIRNYGKFHPMFKAFSAARPKIVNTRNKEAFVNPDFRMGLIALSFAELMMHNNKYISRAIEKMVKEGK